MSTPRSADARFGTEPLDRHESSPGTDWVTLVASGTVVVAAPDGSIDPGTTQGLFYRDRRVVSESTLRINGRRPRLLAQRRTGAATSEQALAVVDGPHDPPAVLVQRRRTVDGALVDELRVEVHAGGQVDEITLKLAADLVPLDKEMQPGDPVEVEVAEPGWAIVRDGVGVNVSVDGRAPTLRDGVLRWRPDGRPGDVIELRVVVTPFWRGTVASRVRAGEADGLRVVHGPRRLRESVQSAQDDLRGLVTPWPERETTFVSAGAPWFMALFGRDSLLAGWESLPTGAETAMDVLETLARFQGVDTDDTRLEEPGRILHELRIGGHDPFATGGAPYYGSVDATPLFVILLDEAHLFGADPERVASLLPAARAALEWCRGPGDLDGDGFVEYRADSGGLENLSWKDSNDSMVHADGSLAEGPIAGCEVQAYVYGAHLALARLEQRLGNPEVAPALRAAAADLRRSFRDHFWLPDEGIVALALDGDKRPLAVATSNMGHALWTGLLDPDVAAVVADRLVAPDLASPWGLRTLAATEAAYNPLGYHLGTVWPHDTALVMSGLARAGFPEHARVFADRLLASAEAFEWRLPELLSGVDSGLVRGPIPYPVACSPQAWSAAVPLVVLRAMLGLEPDVPEGVVRVDPRPVEDWDLEVRRLGLGAEVGLALIDGRVSLVGSDLEVIQAAHPRSVTPPEWIARS